MAKPTLLAKDPQLVRTVVDAVEAQLAETFGRPLTATERLATWFDPNDAMAQRSSMLGVWLIPLAVGAGRRHGTREPLQQAEGAHGLRILRHCLATRLVLDDDGRCTGVEFREGAHQYAADPQRGRIVGRPGPARVVTATREVVVAGGAFNTPQLLMLSGIGPADELRAHGIDVRVDLPGVGANLQDRYEVTVVTRMQHTFDLVTGGAFHPPRPDDPPDPYLADWRTGKGAYTTNGGLLAVVAKSRARARRAGPVPVRAARRVPRLLPRLRRGPRAAPRPPDLGDPQGAHRQPRRHGAVAVGRSDRDAPRSASTTSRRVRTPPGTTSTRWSPGSASPAASPAGSSKLGATELLPGPAVDTDEASQDYVRANAWGHHACGTCAIGPDGDPGGGAGQPVPRARRAGPAGRRRVGVPAHPRLLHRLGRLHGRARRPPT